MNDFDIFSVAVYFLIRIPSDSFTSCPSRFVFTCCNEIWCFISEWINTLLLVPMFVRTYVHTYKSLFMYSNTEEYVRNISHTRTVHTTKCKKLVRPKVSKKRNLAPLRKLVNYFYEEKTTIIKSRLPFHDQIYLSIYYNTLHCTYYVLFRK